MDARNPESSNDFGKDVLPLLLDEGKKLMAYPFEGYWKDVGTVKAYGKRIWIYFAMKHH